MCDYYFFSDNLIDFIDNIKIQIKKENKSLRELKKNKINKILNLEIVIYSCKRIEINVFTEYSLLYEIFIHKLKKNEDKLMTLCKRQSFIYPDSDIIYQHIINIEEFEKIEDRDVYYNNIVKYYT